MVKQSVRVQDMLDTMRAALDKQGSGRFCQSLVLFDEFRPKAASAAIGADEKSLAFRLTLQDTGSTLQDEPSTAQCAAWSTHWAKPSRLACAADQRTYRTTAPGQCTRADRQTEFIERST